MHVLLPDNPCRVEEKIIILESDRHKQIIIKHRDLLGNYPKTICNRIKIYNFRKAIYYHVVFVGNREENWFPKNKV